MNRPGQKYKIRNQNLIDFMATRVPSLSPEFCVSTVSLRGFFRLSRTLDDNITQYLNSLQYQSKSDFDPSSPSLVKSGISGNNTLSANACQYFMRQILFPSWCARDEVLEYCKNVAAKIEMDETPLAMRTEKGGGTIDDRLDPYSSLPSVQTESEILNAVLRQENQVERIVRSRTWAIMIDRCTCDSRNWERSLYEWKKSRKQEEN